MINNTNLEDLLLKWNNGDVETQLVEENISDTTMFLIPIKQYESLDKNGAIVQFILVEQNDCSYILAFTSKEELKKGLKEQSFIVLPFAAISTFAKEKNEIAGILINPYSTIHNVS